VAAMELLIKSDKRLYRAYLLKEGLRLVESVPTVVEFEKK